MKFQAIILAGLMTLGITSFAQEKSEGKFSDKPNVERVERGRGMGPQFRCERYEKRFQKCEVCQAHRKHMMKSHPSDFGPKNSNGPRRMGPPHGR
jgi:hypothetical protein